MSPIIKNILAIVVGLFVGGLVNYGLITISSSVIPLPEGVDPTDPESLKNGIHLFEAKHFIFPFLAHALGSLVGGGLAALIAANHKMKFAIGIGAFFLLGGIVNAVMLPAPMWFEALDLLVAYLPMGWLGGKLLGGKPASA